MQGRIVDVAPPSDHPVVVYDAARISVRDRLHPLLLVVSSWASACTDREGRSTLPPAEVYGLPSNFEGEWMGEVAESNGVLSIARLGEGVYRGIYRAEGQPLEFVLAMEQPSAVASDGREGPSNLVSFTWQDGRGGRGKGWLLINREDSALMGAFGRGEDHGNYGEWNFIRLE
jgi:hypothetical protein